VNTVRRMEIATGKSSLFHADRHDALAGASHNKIIWSVVLRGEIPYWPDVKQELKFEVTPMATSMAERPA